MSFSSVWVSVPASTLEWVHRFSGKGWWLAQPPSPSPKRCFSGKWGPISQGMTLPRAHLFCFLFAFVLLFCLLFCCFFCFFFAFFCFVFTFYLSFLRFLSKSIQFRRSPIRIGDLPSRLVTCPLGRREPQHWAFFFGFTGSPRTSLFKFNASFVFCAGFTTLSRLICCFHVCCIWHFPFSLVAFPCHLLPTCIGYFHVFFICQMCPLPSCICSFYSSSICNFCLFSTCILLSHFFCNCHVCLFQICIFQFHFFCIVSPFFSRCILEQAQFDSTILEFVKGC